MPGFDRTGPEGEGPMTGRRLGRCTGFGSGKKKTEPPDQLKKEDEAILSRSPGPGRRRMGRGGGQGRGFGGGNRFRGGNP